MRSNGAISRVEIEVVLIKIRTGACLTIFKARGMRRASCLPRCA